MKYTTLFCAALVAGTTPTLAAQQWSALGTVNNDGSAFWDNSSSDGASCNAGYVVTGVAGTAGNACSNQRPSGWLPYSGLTPTSYLNNGSGGWTPLVFSPGDYSFSLLSGTLAGGDIAGQNTDWGWYDTSNGVRTSFGGGFGTGPSTSTSWGLWIQMTNNAYAYSGLDAQFAFFGFGATGAAGPSTNGNIWIAGIEDIKVTGGDRDYNDVMFMITRTPPNIPQETVPEPATMTLLATGLAGMAAARRKKRLG